MAERRFISEVRAMRAEIRGMRVQLERIERIVTSERNNRLDGIVRQMKQSARDLLRLTER